MRDRRKVDHRMDDGCCVKCLESGQYPVFHPEADHIPTEDAIVCLNTTAVNTMQCITGAITKDYLQIIAFLQSNSNQIPIGHQITPYKSILDRLSTRKLGESTLVMLDHHRI